jgi:tetratricopeptide (TPR) repeat protein
LDEANSMMYLGDIHRLQSKYDLARDCYEKALPVFQKTANTLSNQATCLKSLGQLYGELGSIDLAITTLNDAIAKYWEDGQKLGVCNCYNSMGIIFNTEKRYQEALDVYDKAIRIAPGGYLYLNRADTCIEMGQYDQAAQAVKAAEKLTPGQSYIPYHRGRLALFRKDPQTALSFFRTAIRITPEEGDFRRWLTLGLAICNQIAETAQALSEALKYTYNVKELKPILASLEKLAVLYGENPAITELRRLLNQAIQEREKTAS